ncbi:coiled-coil domain-containing protein 17 [Melanerpes formicivorus]|uniref:coiled-coil domain-containing protein 17 n=1 Tax=Melanerpes formicivorus TaxID=211600 RepID=UPI00358EB50D
MGGFVCPRCRLAFSSWPLLRVHEEKLCLGPPVPGSAWLPGEDQPPLEEVPGTAGRLRDASVGVSQHGDRAETVPPGLRAGRRRRAPGSARESPLGAVLTSQERALLRAAEPAPRRLTAEQGEPGQPPAPPPGRGQQLQELLEAHQRNVAEIRARTQELEQQREGLCQRLAALESRAAVNTQPRKGELELRREPEALQGRVRQILHGGAALHLDNVLPVTGPLATEARALRLSYLHAGGHDPDILDQLLQLQLEAMELENGPTRLHQGKRMAEPPATGTRGLDAALLAVELENRRLEDELLALKVRRERRADAGSRAAQWHAEELAQLQAEESPGPAALGTGSPTGPSCPPIPSTLPLPPFVALEDPPPPQEPQL